jgi:hypothetical protein
MLEGQLMTPGFESTAILPTGYGCDTSEHCFATNPIESF